MSRVWTLADHRRQGFLGPADFVQALKFIYLAQSGRELSVDELRLAEENGSLQLPDLEGLDKATGLALDGGAAGASNPFGAPAPAPRKAPSAKGALSATQCYSSVVDGLKHLYKTKVKPVEELYKFSDFMSAPLVDGDFDAKPTVLLLGQYSVGKSTFIKHLLKREYPGCHIGPEPTTDRFFVVMEGPEERTTPGNTLCVQTSKPFTGLSSFGTSFMSKLEGSELPNELLKSITLVDTPGVLSGEKQRTDRGYDFVRVCQWFATRADLVLLLFDPHKLDISDEFKRVIMSLKGNDDKVRVVLNKADQVGEQQLMRVYGALMWSLGKCLGTPEVARVYIGSFSHDGSMQNKDNERLFKKEQADLLKDLMDIPRRSIDRKVNEFVKRVRAAKIHAHLVSHLKAEMPSMFGKEKKQQKMLDNLHEEFNAVQRATHLPVGDFPNMERFRDVLSTYDFSKFKKLDTKLMAKIDEVLTNDIPALLEEFRNPYTDNM